MSTNTVKGFERLAESLEAAKENAEEFITSVEGETIELSGALTLTLKDKNGSIIKSKTIKNLIVNVGLAFMISRIIDSADPVVGYTALGTDNTAQAAGDTTLGVEVGRVATNNTQVTTTVADDTAQFSSTFAPGAATGAIVEAGLFNSAVAGIMLARTTFGVITKGVEDSLSTTWKVQLT